MAAGLMKRLGSRVPRIVGLAVVALLATLGAAPDRDAWTSGREAAPPLQPGMLVNVHGVSFVVPPAGTTVWAEVLLGTGDTLIMGVESQADGEVVLRSGEGWAVMEPVGSSGSSPCQDGAYNVYGKKWRVRYEWYFRAESTPSYISWDGAESAFRTGVRSIVHVRNDCGMADHVDARSQYLGRTGLAPNITSAGSCTGGDGKNVVGFGDLPSNYLGLSCWWASDRMLEADVKLNSVDFRWAVTLPAGCSGRWHIATIATHEFGHIFGIGHVTETSHPNLTMSQRIASCQDSEVSLGLGDIRALNSLY